jgi:hypothetical protein
MSVMPTVAKGAAPRDESAGIAPGLNWLAAAGLGVPTTETTRSADRFRSALYIIASLCLLAFVWQTLSFLVGADVLPDPIASVLAVEQSNREGYLWTDIGITAFRVVGAFLIALTAALVIGTLLGPVVARDGAHGDVCTNADRPEGVQNRIGFLAPKYQCARLLLHGDDANRFDNAVPHRAVHTAASWRCSRRC